MDKNAVFLANEKRNDWAKGDALRDKGLTEREDIIARKDICYMQSESADEEKWHLMDVYYPKNNLVDITKHPAIVSIHGGGWFYGDKELYRHYCMKLASYGYAVVNFNYRLSPEYKYPAGFMDVCHLMMFLAENAEEYKLDLDNLFAVGDSAGAQLLSQYSIWATNKEYHKILDPEFKIIAPIPKKIALNCGIYDMRVMQGREQICEWYLDEKTFSDTKEETSLAKSFFGIIDFVTEKFPETYLMASVNDELKPHSIPMKKKLDEYGIKYVYREWGQGVPADGHVFHVNMKSENGIKCNEEEIAFFRGEIC